MGSDIKDKVEIFNNFIIKHNTANFSYGLEWFTELLSINHKRELRVYEWYNSKNHKHLLIPEIYEKNSKYIKIEKLIEIEESEINVFEIIPKLEEFILMGYGQKRHIYDIASSPTQSILRGLLMNAKFLGFSNIIRTFKHLISLYVYKPSKNYNYLIHKDLKTDQNMIATEKGIYFIDFGSSILTKHYFLADVVELSTNHRINKINAALIESFIKNFCGNKYHPIYLRSQIYLLCIRRYMHLPKVDRADSKKMAGIREFLDNLDSLVTNLKL